MSIFKFEYDEDNLRDIKIICEEKSNDLMETIKIFCIDSIPSEYNPEIEETDYGFLIKAGDEGEEILTHLFKYVYLITRMAMIFKDEFEKGSSINEKNLDFSLLRPDIDKVKDLDYKELASLIRNIDKDVQ